MDRQDTPNGLTSPTDAGATGLRLHDPEGPCREGVISRSSEAPGPEVAPFLVAGHPFRLLAWTAAEWGRLSNEERPRDVCRGSKGNYYRFKLDDDRPY